LLFVEKLRRFVLISKGTDMTFVYSPLPVMAVTGEADPQPQRATAAADGHREIGQGRKLMSEKTVRILLVEDNAADARLLREMLNETSSCDYELTHHQTMEKAIAHLVAHPVDIVLLDLGLPDTDGLRGVQRAQATASRVPLVVLTGSDDELLASQALQEGAQDYLVKGQIDTRGLLRALRYAIERKTMEEALFVEKDRAQVTLNCIGDAVISTNVRGHVTYFNAVAETLTGWSREEAIGHPLEDVLKIVDATTRKAVRNPMALAVRKNDTIGHAPNCILIRRDGIESAIEDSAAPIHDREGNVTGAVMVLHDVSLARSQSRKMAHQAQHDSLTDLPNRTLLSDRMMQTMALAQRHKKQLAVLFLDVDRFKHINDSLGHGIGDRLLQSVAQRLLSCVRASDTVSRQGGDEFVILLSEIAHAEDAAISAGRILLALSAPHHIDQHELYLTVSIGIAIYPEDGVEPEVLLKNADFAMYDAKESCRNTYKFFKAEMNSRAVERQSLENDLRHAMERQEFVLHYQPKMNLDTGAIVGVEALIRWHHQARGLVPPAQFIPIAEDCGFIVPIGRWVLREACRQARAWRDAGLPPMCIAVNISAVELRARDFVAGVRAILTETGTEPRYLELELTETFLMQDLESTEAVLRALKEIGVQLALDDFGTGYSSLSYLKRFPIDTLKIDRSFVRDLTTDADDASIVNAVISMGKSLHMHVVAEGVETQEQLAFLQKHGCPEGQGYYFSRPVAAAELVLLLQHGDNIGTRNSGHSYNAAHESAIKRPYYHLRAEEVRKVGEGIFDHKERARVLQIADDYEQLARKTEGTPRARQPRTPSLK
jgi:diguanylate cyclase (GGDEF)-like protein/PAS domain S-box-containing protein